MLHTLSKMLTRRSHTGLWQTTPTTPLMMTFAALNNVNLQCIPFDQLATLCMSPAYAHPCQTVHELLSRGCPPSCQSISCSRVRQEELIAFVCLLGPATNIRQIQRTVYSCPSGIQSTSLKPEYNRIFQFPTPGVQDGPIDGNSALCLLVYNGSK